MPYMLTQAAKAAICSASDDDIVWLDVMPDPKPMPDPVGPPTGPLASLMVTGGRKYGLEVGEILTWHRKRLGVTHQVRVLADGRLEDLAAGKRYESPSGAASGITGGSFDGYEVWRREDGTLIDKLR